MNRCILLGNLLRAAKSNPAARNAMIYQPATDEDGAAIVLPDGSFKWDMIGVALDVFDYGNADPWAGATGVYDGSYHVNVILYPKTTGRDDQPSLAKTFIIENQQHRGDGWPRWTVATQVVSIASAGMAFKFSAREADQADLTGID